MNDAAGGAGEPHWLDGWANQANPFADVRGTLLTVVPAGDGRSRIAIVGYVLPPLEPSPCGDRIGTTSIAPEATASRPPSDLVVDRAEHRFLLDGRDIELLFQEFELLKYLAAHPHRVFTREQLLEQAWRSQPPGAATRTVDVHIHRLRRKLGPAYAEYLLTVRRVPARRRRERPGLGRCRHRGRPRLGGNRPARPRALRLAS